MENKDVNVEVRNSGLIEKLLGDIDKDWISRPLNTKEFFLALRVLGDMKVKSYVEYLTKKEFNSGEKEELTKLTIDIVAFIVEKLPYAQENVISLVASYVKDKPENIELIPSNKFISISLDILINAVPNALWKMAKIDVAGLKKKFQTIVPQ